MRKLFSICIVIIFSCTFYFGCKKDIHRDSKNISLADQELIANAKRYFEGNV